MQTPKAVVSALRLAIASRRSLSNHANSTMYMLAFVGKGMEQSITAIVSMRIRLQFSFA